MMSNLIIKKIWEEGNLLELEVRGESEYVSAMQSCYVQDSLLVESGEKMIEWIKQTNEKCYLEFGSKEGNYTPAFSLCILQPDVTGKLKIEVDIEIADNDSRCHRCVFFVDSELGAVERFGKALIELAKECVGSEAKMFEQQ